MLVRQYTNGILVTGANEEVETYLKWFRRVYTEEKSSSIFAVMAKFTAKKPTYSLKYFFNCFKLYRMPTLRNLNFK